MTKEESWEESQFNVPIHDGDIITDNDLKNIHGDGYDYGAQSRDAEVEQLNKNYLSAVNGRKEFRKALREARKAIDGKNIKILALKKALNDGLEEIRKERDAYRRERNELREQLKGKMK